MTLPVLLVADDDRDALDEVADQLLRRYAADYRVETAETAEAARQRLQHLADEADDVVLVLVAESLAGAPGDGLLEHARQTHRRASGR